MLQLNSLSHMHRQVGNLYQAPVLLRLFKRPSETAVLLDKLATLRPPDVFVWVDSPRNPDEKALVEEVIELVKKRISWCNPIIYANDRNQGMTNAMRSSVEWFFGYVDEGIILEDDCIPGDDFLSFCSQLLERYRVDPRVVAITGDNAAGGVVVGTSSYAFVPDFSVWGWATWRRVWQHYDHELVDWPVFRGNMAVLKGYWPNRVQREQWISKFERIHRAEEELQESTWRFMFTALKLKGLIVLPAVNLISNIGTNPALATAGHRSSLRANSPTLPILPLRHPKFVRVSRITNWTLFFSKKRRNRQATWWYPLKKRFRRFYRSVSLHG